jgi:uncharacterized protein (TIGR02118 family)
MKPGNDSAVGRRAGLRLALAAAGAALLAPAAHAAASGKGMVKVTVLYGEPKDPAAFESYYLGKHMPMVYRVKGIARIELGKPGPGPDGKPPAYYRITELWFKDAATLKAVTARPEWKKIVDDVPNFASGGATILVTPLE